MGDEAEYHSNRARQELDLGLTAKGISASRSHLRLASLHMQRLRELNGDRSSPPLEM
jgi:hypothetical protein